MIPTNLPVTSREYKLMLNTERFKDREQGVLVFLRLIEFLVNKDNKKGDFTVTVQNKNEDVEYRLTSYLDTAEFALKQLGYSLRIREEHKAKDRFKITFKYRGSDRYISAAKDLSCIQKDNLKFEEDILPPFVSKFSHSASAKFPELPDLNNMKDVIELFPGIKNLPIDEETAIKTSNDFVALEVVHKLCQIKFKESPIIKACLSFWYLIEKKEIVEIKVDEIDDWPLVGEFSFDYDLPDSEKGENKLEFYPSRVVDSANHLFCSLQSHIGWVNFNSTTKTAFALETL